MHRVYLELTGECAVAVCSCGWRSTRIWIDHPHYAAGEARSHWRSYSEDPGLWPDWSLVG